VRILRVLNKPMSCRELAALTTEYLEDCLSAREKRRFEEHLAHCSDCPEYVNQIRLVIRAASATTRDPALALTERQALAMFWRLRSEN
jgi:predicted anti-sigma-YlaC factor YlaD